MRVTSCASHRNRVRFNSSELQSSKFRISFSNRLRIICTQRINSPKSKRLCFCTIVPTKSQVHFVCCRCRRRCCVFIAFAYFISDWRRRHSPDKQSVSVIIHPHGSLLLTAHRTPLIMPSKRIQRCWRDELKATMEREEDSMLQTRHISKSK